MDPVAIRVSAPRIAKVQAQAVRPVTVTPRDGARVIVVPTQGPPGPPGPPGDGTQVFNETPSGIQDGANADFSLAYIPKTGSITSYRNGLRESPGSGYTASGSSITFSTPPLSSDVLIVDYLMEG
jgi:hypothetical protein